MKQVSELILHCFYQQLKSNEFLPPYPQDQHLQLNGRGERNQDLYQKKCVLQDNSYFLTACVPQEAGINKKQYLHLSLHIHMFKLRITMNGPRTPNIRRHQEALCLGNAGDLSGSYLKWNTFLLPLADVYNNFRYFI